MSWPIVWVEVMHELLRPDIFSGAGQGACQLGIDQSIERLGKTLA
ncbi:hypothetical protein [Polaromonas vacuolata]|nr:hypothetical protein [Polaromonas vacuolata]